MTAPDHMSEIERQAATGADNFNNSWSTAALDSLASTATLRLSLATLKDVRINVLIS